ncbi:MAG: glycosyltransferase family 2 protein [Flavobacteriales bacterium]|nr:glycosyltransferase family 2 protein [Flavobacteriales bacterium]MCB9166623.1 glycosyltransferase family 2 protein [Flavobacteriales bacterium]
MLSVVIPAHNEEASLRRTIVTIATTLRGDPIPHEIVVVDDHSTDRTWEVLQHLAGEVPELRPLRNNGPNGFGNAIRFGLENYTGDRVTIMMADLSDDPNDLVRFDHALRTTGCDCVFGSRAMPGATVRGYPRAKWMANRCANLFLCAVFQYRYNDTTNPFKLYSRALMDRLLPLRSAGFELEIEIPLKAIVRGARYTVLPNDWNGREAGESKMRLLPLVRPYLRVVAACLAERWRRRNDR